jgi:hypothetical protein
MTKKGRLFFIFLLVMALSLPLQAAPLIGTYESPGDFNAGDWKELLYGGGEWWGTKSGRQPPFYLFAELPSTVESWGGDCGNLLSSPQVCTNYSGGAHPG